MEVRQTSTPHDLRLMLSSSASEASVLGKPGGSSEQWHSTGLSKRSRDSGPRLSQEMAVGSEHLHPLGQYLDVFKGVVQVTKKGNIQGAQRLGGPRHRHLVFSDPRTVQNPW